MPRPVQPLRRGQAIGTDWLDGVRESGLPVASGNRNRVSRGSQGMTISVPDPGAPLAMLAKITTIHDDYLACTVHTPGESGAGRVVNVARPPQLRRTGIDAQTITYPSGQHVTYTYSSQYRRSATDGSTTETQVMTPEYYVGEIVLALPVWTGIVDANGGDIFYMDANSCGRFWAKEAS